MASLHRTALSVADPAPGAGLPGHLVMALAGVVGVVLSFAVLREHEGETAVLVAAHDVRAGERVSRDDFRTARVTLDSRGARHRGEGG